MVMGLLLRNPLPLQRDGGCVASSRSNRWVPRRRSQIRYVVPSQLQNVCLSYPCAMPDSMTDLSFVTHVEIEGLLGGGPSAGQQRRRLVAKGLLPEPKWVRADRQRLGILPEFALASLVVPVRNLDSQHVVLLKAIVRDTRRLFDAASFKGLTDVIRESMPVIGPTTMGTGLMDHLAKTYPGELQAWRADVATIAEDLVRLGLLIETQRGCIIEVGADNYVLKAPDAEATESHPRSDAPFDLTDGLWVARDRVHALTHARDFLLPTYWDGDAFVHAGHDDEEAMFDEMFGAFEKAPLPVRRLPLIRHDEPELDVADPPQLAKAPIGLLGGFTPMTRPRV
jgi:hypothetical protein